MDVESTAPPGAVAFQPDLPCEMEQQHLSRQPDLSQCPWYHGPTTRIASEMSLARDMEFLVRDCISSPGDYVLTTRWRGQTLHFRMNRTTEFGEIRGEAAGNAMTSPQMYQFEDEAFATVPELVLHHVTKQVPISQLTGAVILNPVPRPDVVGASEEVSFDAQSHSPNAPNGPTNGATTTAEPLPNSEKLQLKSGKVALPELPPPPPPPPPLPPTRRHCQKQYYFGGGEGEMQRETAVPNGTSSSRERSKKKQRTEDEEGTRITSVTAAAATKKNCDSETANPMFPQDIDLNGEDLPPTPPPLLSASPTYDVPRGGKPRSCLTDKQLNFSTLYDHPRGLSYLKQRTKQPAPAPPPPPPPRSSAANKSNNSSVISRVKARAATVATTMEDSNSLVSEDNDISNTDDTSYLEHRELTPLLSSDTESVDVFDTTSLPGDPFPAGLPKAKPQQQAARETARLSTTTTSASDSTSSVSSGNSSTGSKEKVNKNIPVCSVGWNSYFEHPSEFRSTLFPNGAFNKPLEPAAVRRVNTAVVSASDRRLAANLAILDQEQLSIRLDREYSDVSEIKSGLHLLTLVDGWKLRGDMMERVLCLRIFVLVTIFTATNWEQSVKTLAKWIRVASITRADFGDNLGFFAIVSALCNRELAGLKMLWGCLAKDFPEEDKTFKERHTVNLERLNTLQRPSSSPHEEIAVTVPHLMPFLSGCKDLKERRSFRLMFMEVFGTEGAESDADTAFPAELDNHAQFQAHIAQVQLYLGQIADYKINADETLPLPLASDEDSDSEEPLLADLFRTELHLRLLWGSSGSLAPAEERHAKFEKVIGALATICKNIERTLF